MNPTFIIFSQSAARPMIPLLQNFHYSNIPVFQYSGGKQTADYLPMNVR
jgi:hypothetical protein